MNAKVIQLPKEKVMGQQVKNCTTCCHYKHKWFGSDQCLLWQCDSGYSMRVYCRLNNWQIKK